MSVYIFETPRLRCRHWTSDDLDALFAVYGDAEAMRWVGDGQPLNRDQCVHWIEVTHRNYALRGYGMFTLVLRQTGAVIGFCGLVHPGGQLEEIKYALLPAFWGQGFATEAVRALFAYGAEAFHLTRIIATIFPQNIASQRVLLKVGMTVTEDRTNEDGTITRVFVWQSDGV